MHILHINSDKDVDKVDKFIKDGSDVFILIYMEGCEPCKATRPEWEKIESALKEQYAKNDKLAVIDVNKDYLSSIKHVGPVDGFPTIKYIGSNGSIVEAYESSSIKKKDRSVSSFINWIESKINKVASTTPTSSVHHVYKRLSASKKNAYTDNLRHTKGGKKTRKRRGKKWSAKYKKRINCLRPKGFSQKQYCKYRRK